ncbi:thymidylate synthase [Lichenihabitans sp. Uapishka_5]|uniref:thymidylate synthase n=1 Tax=Lichenihabitans sp. Uapishka_5 TaxID=3037302 RepID=UPI0029E7D149|nr:thymidylate synthase [Lichenihabitans sp. Uapishka_5]MDX7951261.1 thymidylate synthase [Lichenihabitans sp. Uapishka_5]
MEICGDSLDDILIELYQSLLGSGRPNTGSRGSTYEVLGTAIRLRRPRARLSRSENRGKPFSALAEFLWYLSGSGDLEFIRPYIPDYVKEAIDGRIPGAYGPRIFSMRSGIDQLDHVTKLLDWKPTSKRAVIQLFNAEDIALDYAAARGEGFVYREVPCTVSLQFHLREGLLHLSVNMRSNDAYKGLPHDVFCFTMIQEMMARRLGAEPGEYLHYAGSMHIYEPDLDEIRGYVTEGHQKIVEMPPMPPGDPFGLAETLLEAEGRIRAGELCSAAEMALSPYWADFLRLLQAFWASGDEAKLDALRADIAPAFRIFVDSRRDKPRRQPAPRQTQFIRGGVL